MPSGDDAVLILRAADASLILDLSGGLPRVLHWGADPGALDRESTAALRESATAAVLHNSPDIPRVMSVWPTEADFWSGTPAQEGNVAGIATTPRLELESHDVDQRTDGGVISLRFVDRVSGLRGEQSFELDPFGVLEVRLSVVRDSTLASSTVSGRYALGALRALLPLPERATEVLDFTGKWCRERDPQRLPLSFGTHLRRAHRGKSGHDTPYLLLAGTKSFGFRSGEVWGVHLAWSGESEYLVERLPEGAGSFTSVLGASEALHSGEVLLGDGERYDGPPVLFTWSDAGLDGLAERFHQRLRARAVHPRTPRPVVLNTWEAVYFDHDLERLQALVDRAATVGVERVVLDDGWFHGRRSDAAGLGDWYVDRAVWPDGLRPIVEQVRSRGMQFGLWFEPEMINLDSDLARNHPEWVLGPRQGLGATSRRQYVLDIARPDAYEYVLERVSALVAEYDLDYIKWDHNRDLLEAVGRRELGDRPAVREQTLALYRMLDELRSRHPRLEIETCSGGGGRVDLGILDRTDRIWASDCNDPTERMRIERWTRMLVPPELIGSHLGAARAHTTSRVTDLSFRLAVALTAHAGIEMNLSDAADGDLERIAAWTALYRERRGLIHSGTVVNADLADDATSLQGIVAQDGSRALFTWARVATSAQGQSGRVRFPGLDAAARYRVRVREDLGDAGRHQGADPAWVTAATGSGVEIAGNVLAVIGLPLPTLNPHQALLIDFERLS